MSYLYLKARIQKQTSLHQGVGCEKFHRSIWFVRWFFFKVILNYTWQCSQRCARCNFSPWKPRWSCLGGIRREWIWKLEDTTLFRGVTHCSGLCARHKAEHGSERKRDHGRTSKKHWKPLAQQLECSWNWLHYQTSRFPRYGTKIGFEKYFFVITNRESRNKMNLRKQVALWRHFESDEAQLMEIGEAISLWTQAWPDNDTPQDSSESRTSRTSQLFLGHVMCWVSTESGSRLNNQIEERVGLVNADGTPMMVLVTTH